MLFWKTVSPLFTEENGSKNNKITLAEGGKVLTDMQKYSPLNQPRQSAIAEANAEANSIFLGKKIAAAIYAQWKFFFKNFER